ncbi:MAG: discoidin domain-containing protein [Thermodesulfobacteriota bacterium]|nr:discoidin domain-containing protein [Thermodesulfobacteriota bacterium]
MKRLCLICIAALVLGLAANAAQASEILPASYVFDRATDCGAYCYHDWTGVQLIDGQYGTAPWSADLGNGNAYEWVGWTDPSINVDFDFGASVEIGSIHVGSVQDYPGDVVLPSINIYSGSDGSSWDLEASIFVPESSDNNYAYRTFEFDNLSINARFVRVSLFHSLDGPWTYIDEVDFYQGDAVPVPGAVWLLGSGLLGLLGLRRKFRK